MSSTTNWRAERRADKQAATEAQATLMAAQAEQDRADRQAEDDRRRQQAEHHRQQAEHRRQQREQRRQARRDLWSARLAQLRAWLAEHAGDLLIYQLAVVAAVMAMPPMATWGLAEYGMATGLLLPVITELGMWSFSIAARIYRRRHPDGSIWALLVGVAVFAAVAAGTNFLHGLSMTDGGVVRGTLMAVVSVSGVAAHQLATANRPRPAMERKRSRRIRRFETAALARSVGHVDHTGAVQLLAPAGTYRLTWRRQLHTTAVPGLPVDPVDDLETELGDLIESPAAPADSHTALDSTGSSPHDGAVATLDPPDAAGESTPMNQPARSTRDQQKSKPDRRRGSKAAQTGTDHRPPKRTFDELRAQLRRYVESAPDTVDVTSANSIRQALRCAPESAKRLRDEWAQHQ